MKLRVGTFNVENLLTRHRFSSGERSDTAPAMSLFHFPRVDERDAVERSLAVALEDDKRQMTALALAEAKADLWMLQEVDSLASLQAFFANYVHRIADHRYGHFTLLDGNDRRLGFAEASAERSRSIESTAAARRAGAESLLRQTMFDLNTEFEFQIRRALRPYLVDNAAAAPRGPRRP